MTVTESTTIPFEGQTMTQALAPDVEPTGNDNRAKLLAFGGLALVLVLGLVAYFLVFSGSGDEAPGGAVVRKPSGSAVAPAEEAPAASQPAKKQRITAKSFGRDPFKALITEPVAAVGAPTTSGAAAAVPATSTGTGTVSTPVTQPETSVPTASQPHRFKVVSVAPDNSTVTVKVDGKFYRNLKAGEVFAEFFKVRFIGGSVNDFQYGEESFKVLGTTAVSIG